MHLWILPVILVFLCTLLQLGALELMTAFKGVPKCSAARELAAIKLFS